MRLLSRVTLVILFLASFVPNGEGAVHLVISKSGKKSISNTSNRSGRGRGNDHTWLAKQHDRRTEYDPIIEKSCRRYGVDPVLVRAVIQVESNFNPACVSNKGARGLMQLMPGTAKRFGVDSIHDPQENIRAGVEYLSRLLDMFPNDLARTLAAYNAGENAVIRHRGIPPYEETQEYVRRALSVYYGRPQGTISVARTKNGKMAGGFTSRSPTPLTGTSSLRAVSTQLLKVR